MIDLICVECTYAMTYKGNKKQHGTTFAKFQCGNCDKKILLQLGSENE